MNAEEKIAGFLKFGSRLGLERMAYLMEALGHPEAGLRVLHVAGTNGKGSICRYLYECLLAMGYSAGLFISPYVLDFRERIQVDGEWIPEGDLERLADEVVGAADAYVRETGESPTEFEIITAIALQYFKERGVDFTVLEVGLGGRGDSTNIIKEPLVSVITPIAFDHMDRLGGTIEEIAAEKAGIIKPGCPVVTAAGAASKGEARAAAGVIARRAYEVGAPLVDASRIAAAARVHEAGLCGSRFSCVIGGRRYDGIEIAMAGAHQVENAAVALCALDVLRERGHIRGDGEGLRAGMKRAVMPARFQVGTNADGQVEIYDGAHNEAGARALADTLGACLGGREPAPKLLFVVGILRDKEADAMLRILVGAAGPDGAFLATQPGNERALTADELAGRIRQAGGRVAGVCADPKSLPAETLREYDMIVYAGSLYLMGELLK
ncbi:MAG: bifunctional folylpolyglutamate synthase/dihydrofolate synthase [Clostridiales Family XIII bacterium]|jgi:dihydrofolate synthase/folylpolyglutamate synthase|nr:bifunctional folylpolyglutamate synthase/dihydrofolate synthase [Clostridiales Family XIII bacterium]